MIRRSAALLLVALVPLPAAAQMPPSPLDPAAPAAAAEAAPVSRLTRQDLPRFRDVRATCRDQAEGQGLQGEARRDAMQACMIKARPDKAVLIRCVLDPAGRAMDREAHHTFVKDCVANAKG